MGTSFARIASDGPLLAAMLVAALAGLVSFLSPCVLPLVPGYLSYVTGLAGTTLHAAATPELHREAQAGSTVTTPVPRRTGRARMISGACLFVAGFTAVFLLTGVTLGQAGRFLWQHARLVEIIAGAVTVVLGLMFIGLLGSTVGERRIRFLPRAGLLGAPVLGATFGLGWIPCVSPTLGAVLTLAAVDGTVQRGILLALAYCAGLGLPFIAVAVGMRRGLSFIAATRRHRRTINIAGGIMLIIVGLALLTGTWTDFTIWLRATVGPGTISI